MRISKVLVVLSLILNLIFVSCFIFIIGKKGGISYVSAKIKNTISKDSQSKKLFPYYYDRKDLFSHLKIKNNDIVFLGDSLTDYNEWAEAFSNPSIKNRGIAGDRIWGVYDRLDEITVGQPKKIFIMIGINDIGALESNNSIIDYYDKIIKNIERNSPDTKIFVESLLPVNSKKNIEALPKVKNSEIIDLNKKINTLAKKENINFVNLYPLFEKNGEMNSSLTTDGVHLNSEGYKIWENAISKYIQ